MGSTEHGEDGGDPDRIEIAGLEVKCRIGTTAKERSAPQRLLLDIELVPAGGFTGLEDEIDRTVDYFVVSRRVKERAETGERCLVETLAEDVAAACLEDDKVRAVTVRVRKFILSDAEHVGVRLTRRRKG